MTSFPSKWILSLSTWHKKRRSRQDPLAIRALELTTRRDFELASFVAFDRRRAGTIARIAKTKAIARRGRNPSIV
jgi:hypothetical protein